MRGLPLLERKKRLKSVLGKGKRDLQYVDHWEGDGAKLFEQVCRLGLEGIVSKRIDNRYRAGSSKHQDKKEDIRHSIVLLTAFDSSGIGDAASNCAGLTNVRAGT